MRLYGRRFLKSSMNNSAAARVETRDAVVWDVLSDQRICRVKIQGSDEYIIARYPQNWESTPSWLKTGNAVRITHRSGIRGYVEVTGHGWAVPTSSTNTATPNTPTPPDAIIDGLEIIEIPNGPQMAVMVLIGRYRRNGAVKTVDCIKMKSNPVINMSMGGKMGSVAEVFAVPAVTTARFRIDLVYMTYDGIIGYLQGTPFNSGGSVPDTPTSTYKLGAVFVKQNAQAIYQTDINFDFVAPEASMLEVVITDNDLASTELTTAITVKIKDQYGVYMSAPTNGWIIQGDITSGTGSLSTTVAQGASSGATVKGVMTGQSIVFTYSRASGTEVSPYIEFSLVGGKPVPLMTLITLRDSEGNILI